MMRVIYKSVAWILALGLLLFAVREEELNRVALARPFLTLACIVAGILLLYLPVFQPLRRRLGHAVFHAPRRQFNLALFVLAIASYIAGTWWLFDGIPRLDDEVSALFQGRIFASGRLTLPAPQPPEFFRVFGNIDGTSGYDHLCSMYPPGHPALLSLGVLAGMPWIVNPLLGGGLVVLIAELGRQLYDRRTGRLAGILALFSPFLFILSSTHLSHVPTAFFCALCMWAVVRLLRTRGWGYGALAGFAMGMAFLCRPLTALVVGAVIGLAPLWYWRRSLSRWRAVAAALLLAALGVAVLLAYQHVATGDCLTSGHEVGMGRRARFGFGTIDWARTHTVEIGAAHSARRMQALNEDVLGWPLPAYFFALLPFLLARARKEDVWLLLPSLGLLLVFMAYWYYEQYFPARYIFAAVPMLLVLAARGCTAAHAALEGRSAWTPAAVPAAIAAGILFNLCVFLPERTAIYGETYADVETVLPRVLAAHDLSGSVLFMDSVDRLKDHTDPFNDFYATGFMLNDLDFAGDIVFARNLKERNRALAERFPDRDYYLYRYHRGRDRALLYRVAFDGAEQVVTPLETDCDLLMPQARVAQAEPRDAVHGPEHP